MQPLLELKTRLKFHRANSSLSMVIDIAKPGPGAEVQLSISQLMIPSSTVGIRLPLTLGERTSGLLFLGIIYVGKKFIVQAREY
jgi:hypothetical protein